MEFCESLVRDCMRAGPLARHSARAGCPSRTLGNQTHLQAVEKPEM